MWPLSIDSDSIHMNSFQVHPLAFEPVIGVQIPRHLAKDSIHTINLTGLVDSDLASELFNSE